MKGAASVGGLFRRCRHRRGLGVRPWRPTPPHGERALGRGNWMPPRVSSILVCHLPKSAKQMLVVEFADLEIGSAAERYRPSMAKYLPKRLRALYRGGRVRAINGFTGSNAAINEIERQCHERNDFGHSDPPHRA